MVTKARGGQKAGRGEAVDESGPMTEPRGRPTPDAQGRRAIVWHVNDLTKPVTRKKKKKEERKKS